MHILKVGERASRRGEVFNFEMIYGPFLFKVFYFYFHFHLVCSWWLFASKIIKIANKRMPLE